MKNTALALGKLQTSNIPQWKKTLQAKRALSKPGKQVGGAQAITALRKAGTNYNINQKIATLNSAVSAFKENPTATTGRAMKAAQENVLAAKSPNGNPTFGADNITGGINRNQIRAATPKINAAANAAAPTVNAAIQSGLAPTAIDTFDVSPLAQSIILAAATGGIASGLGAAGGAAGAAGSAGTAGTAGAGTQLTGLAGALNSAGLGSTASTIGAGALQGAATNAGVAALQGNNIGKAALTGGLTGGLGAGVSTFMPAATTDLGKIGMSAAKGAITGGGGALIGGSTGKQAAQSALLGGALSGGTTAIDQGLTAAKAAIAPPPQSTAADLGLSIKPLPQNMVGFNSDGTPRVASPIASDPITGVAPPSILAASRPVLTIPQNQTGFRAPLASRVSNITSAGLANVQLPDATQQQMANVTSANPALNSQAAQDIGLGSQAIANTPTAMPTTQAGLNAALNQNFMGALTSPTTTIPNLGATTDPVTGIGASAMKALGSILGADGLAAPQAGGVSPVAAAAGQQGATMASFLGGDNAGPGYAQDPGGIGAFGNLQFGVNPSRR